MLQNYLKTAFRNLWRKKGYTLINILGLSIGIACCLLILMHIRDETSYDKYHEHASRVYRMALERIYPDHVSNYAIIPAGFADVLVQDIPEVEEVVRLRMAFGETIIEYGDHSFEEYNVMFADSGFFHLFSIPLLEGDVEKALAEPNRVVLTQSSARKYFGDEDAVGKILKTAFGELMVSGVCEDVPKNTHFEFDLLISFISQGFLIDQPQYMSFSSNTYLLLNEQAEPKQVEEKFPEIVEKYAAGQIQRRLGMSYAEYVQAGNGYNYFLQALPDIYLHSRLENELKPTGDIRSVYLFTAIAIFILLIACINFMNLATARSADRAKEVGVRKVMGAFRSLLISQFLIEAMLISFVSLGFALVLVQIALPFFNEFAGKNLELNAFENLWWIPLMILFALIVGLLAGSYPAFVLSGFKPVTVLKGKFQHSKSGNMLRKGLVVFQFAISIILIAATITVYRQMQFMQNKDLGFEKEQLLVIERLGSLQNPENDKSETFRKEVSQLPEVLSSGMANSLPGNYFYGIQFQQPEGGSEVFTFRGMNVDDYFIESMKMEMMAGRSFSETFNDSLAIIFNERAIRELGIEDPIGKQIIQPGNNPEDLRTYTIVGVVKDFHYQSMHENIGSLAILSTEGVNNFLAFMPVRFQTADLNGFISDLEDKWKSFTPNVPFAWHFLDDELNRLYENELRTGKMFGVFSLLAIIVACVGLLGLSAFVAQQRRKEIGVRKVLGASIRQIVMLLTREFSMLVFFSLLFAIPIIWFGMNLWLESFAYHVEVGVGVFFISGLLALGVSWLTISYQSIKAAIVNPIESLRDE